MMPTRSAAFCAFLAISLTALLLGNNAAQAATARELVEQSGVPGGLIVHLGCGDGKFTADLHIADRYVVQGLDADAGKVAAARRLIQQRNDYGAVSVVQLSGKTLPYADNLVTLLIVDDASGVSEAELMRVVSPLGVMLTRDGDQWTKTVKAWPAEMDEWTHFLHGPDGNAVGHDRLVGPPQHLQWVGGPKYARGHEQQASFSSCVTAGGRMYYIIDDAPTADVRIPSQWTLVCRDAFNGVILWKRPMGEWVTQFRRFRSGPVDLQTRIVATRDRLFVTFDLEGPVSVLDAQTGKTERTIDNSEFTKQIIYKDGHLILLIDEQAAKLDEIDAARRRGEFIPHTCRIMRVDPDTGRYSWSHDINELVFPSVVAKNGKLFAQSTKRVMCIDEQSGQQKWEKDFGVSIPVDKGKISTGEMQWEAPSLVVSDDGVYAADFKTVFAYSLEDGKTLWQSKSGHGYNSPPDVHVINGLFWMNQGGKRVGMDPKTGKVEQEITEHKGYMHDRCYRNKATDQFMLLGKMGVQMLDLKSGEVYDNDWIRGTCQYGVLPANGLLYIPPDSCACNMKTKLSGIYALAAREKSMLPKPDAKPILEKGPAFGNTAASDKASANDWPTFRGTPGRNGVTGGEVPADLKQTWRTEIGGRLSAVTVADGQVYVAAIDQHTVHCLNATSGKPVWAYTTGARVDTPPTIYHGVAFFGSADGWVYAVRAADGVLAWRLRVAPDSRMIMNLSQLESAWPVHGAVLLHNGELKVAAGQSSYLDGGIRLYRIKPETGEVIANTCIYSPDADGKQVAGGGKDVRGALSDVLLAQGNDIYMRHLKLDFATGEDTESGTHLFSPLGFLDDTWWHRGYWVYHDEFISHWSGWWKVGNYVPSGRIMSYDDNRIYGFGRDKYPGGNTGQWRGGEHYQLYAADPKKPEGSAEPQVDRRGKPTKAEPKPQFSYVWQSQVPLLANSLVAAPNALFAAGPPDLIEPAGQLNDEALTLKNPEEVLDAWLGKKGGILYIASASDGKKLAQYPLASPTVFDGMAAANGNLYLAHHDGSVTCMSGGK
ncbi:MAG: PQQ-binding-like beta-propeller repeat protein [Phycisphaera sp.]|nr:PQQ-binding-like beta-propeller repeat protein [Phycisphaera sp.]